MALTAAEQALFDAWVQELKVQALQKLQAEESRWQSLIKNAPASQLKAQYQQGFQDGERSGVAQGQASGFAQGTASASKKARVAALDEAKSDVVTAKGTLLRGRTYTDVEVATLLDGIKAAIEGRKGI